MEFNVETIKGLTEGATYIIEFPKDMSIENCTQIVQNLNQYLKDNNRDIVFIYIRKGGVEIKGVDDYGI